MDRVLFLFKYVAFAGFIIVQSAPCSGQENNYWFLHQGANASLTGGAVVANVLSQSAAFYNPGALQIIELSSIGANANTYVFNDLTIGNGAGNGLDLRDPSFQVFPPHTYGIIKSDKNPENTTSYSILTRRHSKLRLFKRNEFVTDLVQDSLTDPTYLAGFGYENTIQEIWLGLSKGWQIGDHLGIGLSTFFVVNTMEYSELKEASITLVSDHDSLVRTVGSSSQNYGLSYVSMGLLWKLGLLYKLDDINIGLTVTSPMVNVNFIGKATLSGLEFVTDDDILTSNPKYLIYQERIKTRTRKPLVIDLGITKKIKETDLSLRVAYYTRVKMYEMVHSEDLVQSGAFQGSDQFGVPAMAHKPVLNVGLGVRHALSDKWDLMGGFNTDFNYLDIEALNQTDYLIPSIATWDIYAISFGGGYLLKSARILAGVSYQWSRSYNQKQLVNLTEPSSEDLLFGKRNANSTVALNALSLNLGFVFSLASR